jgi:hypothetical protein
VAQPSSAYEPRDPASGVLHQIVPDHFETFRAQAASVRDGEGLPRFVEQEFRDFLRCGCLAGGFARFRCAACGLGRLVAFSCKGRGFCPRCGGRCMAERSSHLVDHVFPDVPVRQWVLSLPHRLRYLLAWDHELCRAVVGVALRVVLGFLGHRARRDGIADGRSGAVAIIQRFGGALNLNVHLHALVLDGVFAVDGSEVDFHPVRRLTREDVAAVVALIARRVEQLLERRGLAGSAESGGAPDLWSEEAPVLAAAAAASVEGRVALGPRAGARVRRCGDPPEDVAPVTLAPSHARVGGFDLHAGLMTRAGQRDRLERLCRYALRPPLAQDRLHLSADGEIWLTLRHRWSDGTTHLRFEPLELLERLAVVTPRPRVNLILYYGVLAPRAAWRAALVPSVSSAGDDSAVRHSVQVDDDSSRSVPLRSGGYQWAELMQRTFAFDVLACPRCGGRLRLVALIEQACVVRRILSRLGLPSELPDPRPARAPPRRPEGFDDQLPEAREFDPAW